MGIRAAPGRPRRFPGGIGLHIQIYICAFQYDKVATLTAVVLVMVIAVEQLSVWIRRLR